METTPSEAAPEQPYRPLPSGLLSAFWAVCRLRLARSTPRVDAAYVLLRDELAAAGYAEAEILDEQRFAGTLVASETRVAA